MSRPNGLRWWTMMTRSLPVVSQCRLLKVARSSLYYRPAPVSAEDLAVMRRMDELHLALAFLWIAPDDGGAYDVRAGW